MADKPDKVAAELAAIRAVKPPWPDDRGPGQRKPCLVCPGTGWIRHNARHEGLCNGCLGYGTRRIAPPADLSDLPARDKVHLNVMLSLMGGERIA
jgi:hypothetical protein